MSVNGESTGHNTMTIKKIKIFFEFDILTPDIGRISFLLFHLFDVIFSVLSAHAPVSDADLHHQVPHVLGHHLGVTAHVQVCSLGTKKISMILS